MKRYGARDGRALRWLLARRLAVPRRESLLTDQVIVGARSDSGQLERVAPLGVVARVTGVAAGGVPEEDPLQVLRDLAGSTGSDHAVLDLDHRGDLRGRPGHEDLVGVEETLRQQIRFDDLEAVLATDDLDRVPGDARQDVAELGRDEPAAEEGEDVHAGALGDVPARIEHDGVFEPARLRTLLDDRAQSVAAGVLGGVQVTRHVGTADLTVDRELGARSIAEILAPWPGDHNHLEGVVERAQPERPLADEDDGADVPALAKFLGDVDLLAGPDDLFRGVRDFDAEDARAVEQPRDVVAQPKDVVPAIEAEPAADPLEDAVSVVKGVGCDREPKARVGDDLAVAPDPPVVDVPRHCSCLPSLGLAGRRRRPDLVGPLWTWFLSFFKNVHPRYSKTTFTVKRFSCKEQNRLTAEIKKTLLSGRAYTIFVFSSR